MGQMGHAPGMKSRVHPKYKTKSRVSNWAEYDQALVQRGDITLWISEDAIASWKPAPTGLRGAQKKFSDHAIETALTLRTVFKLPLRQAEGFLRSVLSLVSVELEAPDHTTLSRRSQDLNVDLHRVAVGEPIHLIRRQHRVVHCGRGTVGSSQVWRTRQARLEETPHRCRSIWIDCGRSPLPCARHPKSQEAEALIACNILNLMTEIGRPEFISIDA